MTTIVTPLVDVNFRVWLCPEDGQPIYADNVIIFRYLQNGDKARLILKAYPFENDHKINLFKDFQDGYTVQAAYGHCGDPSQYANAKFFYTFNNCKERRRWLNSLGSLASGGELVAQWLELECDLILEGEA